MATTKPPRASREVLAFRPYDGLQILWPGDDDIEPELEFIPRRILEASSVQFFGQATTAAICERGQPRSYRYPVQLTIKRGEPHVTYRSTPSNWPSGWALIKGTTTIKFSLGTHRPTEVEWHGDGEPPELLNEGTDWVCRPPQPAPIPIAIERPKIPRMVTEPPDQAWLRAVLLAERDGCLVSDVTTEEALEACHIIQVKDKGTMTSATHFCCDATSIHCSTVSFSGSRSVAAVAGRYAYPRR
jgi:hypothetical protein